MLNEKLIGDSPPPLPTTPAQATSIRTAAIRVFLLDPLGFSAAYGSTLLLINKHPFAFTRCCENGQAASFNPLVSQRASDISETQPRMQELIQSFVNQQQQIEVKFNFKKNYITYEFPSCSRALIMCASTIGYCGS
jgi:hypothetical protein